MSAALDDSEVAALLAPVGRAPGIALAVSGGGDSLALLDVVDRWRRAPGRPRVIVLTVDHALSPGSADVAHAVIDVAAARGLPARLLRWEGAKPDRDIEASARRARYDLMIAAAHEVGATHILTAHHLEDQAETFLMRLSRGSGAFGLAAMRPMVERDGCALFRPFLAVPRARLAATTTMAGLSPHHDPMNDDPRFLRVRMRALMPRLASIGVTSAVLAAAAAARAVEADAIEAIVDRVITEAVLVDRHAVASLPVEALHAAEPSVRFRLLVRLLLAVGGGEHPPRAARVEALLDALVAGSGRRTLGGAVVERRGETMRVLREAGRQGVPELVLTPGLRGVWDHRFTVSVARDAEPGLRVAALGRARLTEEARADGVPAAVRATLPGVFRGDALIAIPSLDWGAAAGVSVEECVSRRLARLSIVSHMADGNVTSGP